jgi:hypothetical protein
MIDPKLFVVDMNWNDSDIHSLYLYLVYHETEFTILCNQ